VLSPQLIFAIEFFFGNSALNVLFFYVYHCCIGPIKRSDASLGMVKLACVGLNCVVEDRTEKFCTKTRLRSNIVRVATTKTLNPSLFFHDCIKRTCYRISHRRLPWPFSSLNQRDEPVAKPTTTDRTRRPVARIHG
jgi:hypothetical protein